MKSDCEVIGHGGKPGLGLWSGENVELVVLYGVRCVFCLVIEEPPRHRGGEEYGAGRSVRDAEMSNMK